MAHTVPWHLLRTSAPLPAELVTHRLKSCDSVRRLLQLHEEHADGFNAYHASALWSRAGRLAFSEPSEREWALRNEGSAFGAVRVATAALSPQMSGRNVANASYGIWRARLPSLSPPNPLSLSPAPPLPFLPALSSLHTTEMPPPTPPPPPPPPPSPCPLHSFLLRSGEPASGSPMPGSPLCSSLINSPLKQHTHSQRLSIHRQPLWSSLAASALSSADTLGAADCQRRTEIESTRHTRQPLSRSS